MLLEQKATAELICVPHQISTLFMVYIFLSHNKIILLHCPLKWTASDYVKDRAGSRM